MLKLLVCVHVCVTGGQRKLFDPETNTGLSGLDGDVVTGGL